MEENLARVSGMILSLFRFCWFPTRLLEADDAQHYLQGIFRHLLKDSAVVMVPEASLGPLSLQDEATEHLTYRLMKTPCNKIEWHVDLMDGEHLCITEIEELALGSDIIWSMRRRGSGIVKGVVPLGRACFVA